MLCELCWKPTEVLLNVHHRGVCLECHKMLAANAREAVAEVVLDPMEVVARVEGVR